MQRTIEVTLSTALAAAGTVNVAYPAGFDENHFSPVGHKITVKNGGDLLQGSDFAVTLTKTLATITAATGFATLAAGTTIFVELRLKGDKYRDKDFETLGAAGNRISRRIPVEVNFGSPATADVDAVLTTYNGTVGAVTLDGVLAVGGVVTLDVPRNLVVDSGGADTAVLTFTGTDEYGVAMVEAITLNGTTAVLGKKAFKTITSCVSSGATIANGAFVGTGSALGLPIFLPNAVNILYDAENGAAATDGVSVAGVVSLPTATTGDVRGTFTPDSALDGADNHSLVMLVDNADFLGVTQYAG